MAYHFETRCIYGDKSNVKEHPYRSIPTPIFLASAFGHEKIGDFSSYSYSRVSNPTRSDLEEIISSLEGAADTVATSSGMSAVSIVLDLFSIGDHFVCSEDLYGGSFRLFDNIGRPHGLDFSFVNTADPAAVEAAIRPETRALYIETPSNPTMQVTDLRAMREIADRHHLLLIVDNTFMTPYFQTPFDFGADIIVHSGTKYLSGHNDVLAGFVCSKDPELAERIRFIYKSTGYNLSPFDSYLCLRGLKTLAVRLDRQQENALAIAQWLRTQPHVKHVYYTGLKDHPGHDLHCSQARGFGGMISFHVDSEETARKILLNVQLLTFAESLGGIESLITYPMCQTHEDLPMEQRERLGINNTFLRISTGIENSEDLISDLDRAMNS
ncbi:MAG: PLP-dependent aspartate aminotransferase family protein [Bacillota bacterium]|nr:PLP-dependent aspartate aminotransferase family protein [Clostridium sp.]MDT3844756.1 PLP-dependent aspartate aminotransferase family protein [Bacillota bacterium]